MSGSDNYYFHATQIKTAITKLWPDIELNVHSTGSVYNYVYVCVLILSESRSMFMCL